MKKRTRLWLVEIAWFFCFFLDFIGRKIDSSISLDYFQTIVWGSLIPIFIITNIIISNRFRRYIRENCPKEWQRLTTTPWKTQDDKYYSNLNYLDLLFETPKKDDANYLRLRYDTKLILTLNLLMVAVFLGTLVLDVAWSMVHGNI